MPTTLFARPGFQLTAPLEGRYHEPAALTNKRRVALHGDRAFVPGHEAGRDVFGRRGYKLPQARTRAEKLVSQALRTGKDTRPRVSVEKSLRQLMLVLSAGVMATRGGLRFFLQTVESLPPWLDLTQLQQRDLTELMDQFREQVDPRRARSEEDRARRREFLRQAGLEISAAEEASETAQLALAQTEGVQLPPIEVPEEIPEEEEDADEDVALTDLELGDEKQAIMDEKEAQEAATLASEEDRMAKLRHRYRVLHRALPLADKVTPATRQVMKGMAAKLLSEEKKAELPPTRELLDLSERIDEATAAGDTPESLAAVQEAATAAMGALERSLQHLERSIAPTRSFAEALASISPQLARLREPPETTTIMPTPSAPSPAAAELLESAPPAAVPPGEEKTPASEQRAALSFTQVSMMEPEAPPTPVEVTENLRMTSHPKSTPLTPEQAEKLENWIPLGGPLPRPYLQGLDAYVNKSVINPRLGDVDVEFVEDAVRQHDWAEYAGYMQTLDDREANFLDLETFTFLNSEQLLDKMRANPNYIFNIYDRVLRTPGVESPLHVVGKEPGRVGLPHFIDPNTAKRFAIQRSRQASILAAAPDTTPMVPQDLLPRFAGIERAVEREQGLRGRPLSRQIRDQQAAHERNTREIQAREERRARARSQPMKVFKDAPRRRPGGRSRARSRTRRAAAMADPRKPPRDLS